MVRVTILSNDAFSKIVVGQYWKKILGIKYTINAFADNGTVECYGFEYCLFGSIRNFYWMNEGKIVIKEDRITMTAPALTDFFCGGETISEEGILPESLCNAPYYYTEIEGDFVLKVKVSHKFKETYDSASIMVMQDMKNWAKCCFELTDFGTHAAVSVVTKNGESDDANGCNIEGRDYLWLKVCRVGRAFSFHYSLDGEKFNMTRYFLMPESKVVKVGLLAQAPTGSGGDRIYENLSIELVTVKNIRFGE